MVTAFVVLLVGALTTMGAVTTTAAVGAAAGVTPAGNWAFDEGGGGTAADSSANGHTGTLGSGTSCAATRAETVRGLRSTFTRTVPAYSVTVLTLH